MTRRRRDKAVEVEDRSVSRRPLTAEELTAIAEKYAAEAVEMLRTMVRNPRTTPRGRREAEHLLAREAARRQGERQSPVDDPIMIIFLGGDLDGNPVAENNA